MKEGWVSIGTEGIEQMPVQLPIAKEITRLASASVIIDWHGIVADQNSFDGRKRGTHPLGRLDSLDQESRRLRDQIASLEERVGIMANDLTTKHNTLAEVVRGLRNDLDRAGEHLRTLQLQAETAQRATVRHDLESLEQRRTVIPFLSRPSFPGNPRSFAS